MSTLGETIFSLLPLKGNVAPKRALADFGFDTGHYVGPQNLKVSVESPKNIIVISLESFEKGWISSLEHLTPNLNALRRKWFYSESFISASGTQPTLNSLYSYQTGLPAYFNFNTFEILENKTPDFVTMPAVLKKIGYNLSYAMSKPTFGGSKKFLSMLGFDNVLGESGRIKDKNIPLTSWGFHDKEIFDLAKGEIHKLHETGRPFFMGLSTVDTHLPKYLYDPRIAVDTGFKGSETEQIVRYTDFLVGDFIDYLDKSGVLENSIVLIMPDHLGVGGDPPEPYPSDRRGLFLLTNASLENIPFQADEIITHFDLPRFLTGAAGIKTNATWFKDYIPATATRTRADLNKWILDNRMSLITLNKSIWKDPLPQLCEISRNNKRLTLSCGSDSKTFEVKPGRVALFRAERFSRGYPMEIRVNTPDKLPQDKNSLNPRNILITVNEKGFMATIGHRTSAPETYYSKSEKIVFDLNDSRNFKHANAPQNINPLRTDDILDQQALEVIQKAERQNEHDFVSDPNAFIAHAGGAICGEIYTNSKEALELAARNGFKFIELDFVKTKDGKLLAAHGWKEFNEKTSSPANAAPVTLEEALARKINGRFTPVGAEYVRAFFEKHPDLYLVTDKIRDYDLLAKEFPDNDRLIVEVFSLEGYLAALHAGIQYPALCVSYTKNYPTAMEDVRRYKIKRITSSVGFILNNIEQFQSLHAEGVAIFGYGRAKNAPAPDTKQFFDLLFSKNVISKYYSDYWNPIRGNSTATAFDFIPMSDTKYAPQ